MILISVVQIFREGALRAGQVFFDIMEQFEEPEIYRQRMQSQSDSSKPISSHGTQTVHEQTDSDLPSLPWIT